MTELPECYTGNDFYCDVALPRPDRLDLLYDGEAVIAFQHTKPYWEHHAVVVPKRHIPSLLQLSGEPEPLVRELLQVIQLVAADFEQRFGAARVLTNLGRYQDSKHLHVHISAGPELS
ncbi:MAG: HIT domain-containing protein [Renibacterium sp.]|nr:HIT domain-containing protein [Renibacterium sp.]